MPVKTKMASRPRELQGVKVCVYFLLLRMHLRSVLTCSLEYQDWEAPAQPACFKEERRGKGTGKETVVSLFSTPGLLHVFLRLGGDFHFIDLKTEAPSR